MKYAPVWLLASLMLAACAIPYSAYLTEQETDDPAPTRATHPLLQDLGQAPELQNEVWLNVDGPLRLADLEGKVVLLDMWTFG